MFGWFSNRYKVYYPPNDEFGRAAEAIAIEISHSDSRRDLSLDIEDIVRVLREGQSIGVLNIANKGYAPDQLP